MAYGRPFDGRLTDRERSRSRPGYGFGNGRTRGEASGKFANHVFRRRNALRRAVADERIRAEAPRAQDVSRNREHLFSEIEGEFRRDETAGFFRRLGYERTVGKTSHQRVSDGKMVCHRSGARSESGNDGAARLDDRVEKSAVRPGVIDIDARSDERDGNAARFDGREMGGGIDSRGSSGYGRDAA